MRTLYMLEREVFTKENIKGRLETRDGATLYRYEGEEKR